ncbi:hypothetical protein DL98DRAFT_593231 [Cadophora sp. DSE1049]|nr:hypothetical protein DL98DRAFT_593231 [Cadophora sp. DSE1049]
MAFDPVYGYALAVAPIKDSDINSTERYSGWLTDMSIRHIIDIYGNTSALSGVNLVDPEWLSRWDGLPPATTPWFLTSRSSSSDESLARPLQGLAMPFHSNNSHWTTIYVNFEARGAVYFDSLGGEGKDAETRVRRFFDVFRGFFQGSGGFRWEVWRGCAMQGDGSACGVYTVRNCLDLLDRRVPRSEALSAEQIRCFRRNAGKCLRRRLEREGI